jgi:hypothetical protein
MSNSDLTPRMLRRKYFHQPTMNNLRRHPVTYEESQLA